MRKLNYELKQLCWNYRDGSFCTQRDRERQLTLIADQLVQLGFRNMRARSLKPKHVEALVQRWKEEGISPGTMKNRMATLRWWANKIHKTGIVRKDNDSYGIDQRVFVTNESKGKTVTHQDLSKVKDVHVRMSLILQREFGLRREEAIKFRPSFADQGNKIVLKDTWTKGGKEREIPVRTDRQRQALQSAHRLAGNASLIPAHLKYKEQVRVYERHSAAAGLTKMHGLRHRYAQCRYFELTGWKAPTNGGPTRSGLNAQQREQDEQARQVISRELGHERIQITAVYLGK